MASSGIRPVESRLSSTTTKAERTSRAVFLCAGAVESPRLLLHAGLANSSGQVGRNFMVHVATQTWGTFDHEVRMNRGFPATVISEDTLRPADADFAGGYLVQSLGVVPVTFSRSVARGRGLWGKALVDYLEQYNRFAGIGVNGDCLPYDHNKVTLSDELDVHGVPIPRIDLTLGESERRMAKHAAKLMTSAWEAAGATDIWSFDRTAHTIGTCRMGDDPGANVVDGFGRSHDVDNLWISDNSTFPSAVAANPALSIMALALRTARQFLRTR
jgi:choline dehydrogenase-like flavoprotein